VESEPDAADAPTDTAADHAIPTLTEQERDILDFERQWWPRPDAKEQAIRVRFGMSAARYYQVLNTVIDSPPAVVHDPMLVKRLQRLRDARAAARSAGSLLRSESGPARSGR
jgi:Protein of unknown function (DUF3263).